MKTIVAINTVSSGSTGKIAQSITNAAKLNYRTLFVCGRGHKGTADYLMNKSKFFIFINSFLARLTGRHENFNYYATKKMLNWLDKQNPSLIHIHNLHGDYINKKLLFNYFKQKNIPIVWTFHDCWPFTGKCPHFEGCNCQKWQSECSNCPLVHTYPKSWFFDRSKTDFRYKKNTFSSLENLVVVTPSNWLAKLVNKSFFNGIPQRVINNGIDLSTFKFIKTTFREKHQCKNQKLLLGVANPWSSKKGLNIFNELALNLDPRKYKIVLVGIKDEKVNEKIITYPKVNMEKLVEIYNSCDYLINPTTIDNFPTVNIEALACGLPVISYDTGGCAEQINPSCGIVVEKNNYQLLKETIEKEPLFNKKHCREWASANYSQELMNEKYIALYNELIFINRKDNK